jgi:hypothetical protein
MRPLALPLLLALTVSVHATLVPVSSNPVTAPGPDVAAFDQAAAQIATDGDAFLAVWIDHTLSGVGDIHGSRVSPAGKRVDDDVLRIAVTDADENRVAVAYGGNRYLVVWSTPAVLRARFVGRDGALSDAFEIAALTGFAQPRVAFNGNRFLVVWSAGPVFRGAAVDTSGGIVKTFDVASTARTFQDTALVAANGAFAFVTAIVDFNGVPNGNGYPSDVGVTTIDENGTVSPRVVVAPAATPVFDVRAASTGTEILVAWSTALAIPGGTVRNVRVTAAGAGAIDVIPAEGMYLHDVAADGSGFLVFYGADGTKYIRRPGASQPLGTVATPPTQTTLLASASNGARTLVIVRGAPRPGFEFGPAGGDLYVTRLDTMEIDPLVVAPRQQSSPDIATAGQLSLAAWCEYIGSDRRLGIVASRIGPAGDSLDLNGIDLHAGVFHPVAPRVASNGTDWLVTWVDGTSVYAARVSNNGTALDAAPILVASNVYYASDIAVSWDGTRYVVVYYRGQFLRGLQSTIRAARITAQGTMPEPEVTLSEIGPNDFPTVASSPEGSLVVWRGGLYLQGALLSRGGTVTKLGFPQINVVGPRPSVAWSGGTYLVAAPFRGSFGDQIQWLLVSAAGVVRTPLSTFLPIDATLGSGTGYPTVEVESYGGNFLVWWNGVAADTAVRMANVYAAIVKADGILLTGPVLVDATVVDYAPSIGAGGPFVVVSRKIGHSTRELSRVYVTGVQYIAGKPRRRAVR